MKPRCQDQATQGAYLTADLGILSKLLLLRAANTRRVRLYYFATTPRRSHPEPLLLPLFSLSSWRAAASSPPSGGGDDIDEMPRHALAAAQYAWRESQPLGVPHGEWPALI